MPLTAERLSPPEPLHARVYRIVRGAIVTREFEPGSPLNESELARSLGVSRSPIRDAMQSLHREGLVVRSANGRYYVTRLSRAELDSIYTVRASLEGLAAWLACQKVTEENIQSLEEILRREKQAANHHDSASLIETGTAFHEWVIEHAGNPILSELVQTLRGRTFPFTVESSRLRSRETDAVREHEQFIEILRGRDATAARTMMEHHLDQSRLRLLEALERTANDSTALHPSRT